MSLARLFLCALFVIVLVGSLVEITQATDYYISPIGNDTTGLGTLASPWATPTKAYNAVAAGDTIFARGGSYMLNANLALSKNGTSGSPINFFSYPGETPILDFRGETYSASNSGAKGISLNGNYWNIKGLTIQYAADNGIAISGSNNIVNQVVARQNQDSGFLIGTSGGRVPSNNLILNCDSYGNCDFGALGENADGFAVKFRGLGSDNVISGARSYSNSDDGFDFWQAEHGVKVINSWAFHNGIKSTFSVTGTWNGDGNGIKLGHDSGTHLIENMLIWGNPAYGVDINGNATTDEGDPPAIAHGVQIYNVTAANNQRNFNFDEDPTTASPPTNHVLRNNISFGTGTVTLVAGNTADHNTFAGPGGSPAGLNATAADFVSTVDPVTSNPVFHPAGSGGDRSGVTTPNYGTGAALGPRQADGSLPILTFLRLAGGSHLIDAGVDVGITYYGSAPDVGAFETIPVLANNGDYDDNGTVNAADIDILWHIVRGTGTDPGSNDTADLNGDGVANEDDVDTILASKLTVGAGRAYGDADLVGGVGPDDFTAWRVGGSGWANGDFDGSGDVGPDDFTLWRTAPTSYPLDVGPRPGDVSAVPEPSTWCLMAIGALSLFSLKRPSSHRQLADRH